LANDASYGSSDWNNIVSTPNTNNWNVSSATCYNVDVSISNYLKLTNFGFSIPTGSTILGITVELSNSSVVGTERFNSCRIVKNNVIVGTEKGDNSVITPSTKTVGGSSDLWGTTWTAADISASNFGVVFAIQGYSVGSGVAFQGARITINYLSSRQSFTATGTVTLTKAGVINEGFGTNLNNFQQTNTDAGYATNTGSGQVGDGSGGLSYSGYLTRSDAYPTGYAEPAILFAPCSPNFTAEMKFLTPNNSTGSLTEITISLFYRVKDANNYRAININWLRNVGIDRFYISDELKLAGVITEDTWFGVDPMIANQESYIIFKFRVVNDKMTIVFNNLNTLSTVTAEKNLFSPSSLSKEGGVGLGFDSNQKLISINSNAGSTSFKPDYFQAYNIPYENLNQRFVSSGQLTLAGSSSARVKLWDIPSGILTLGGTASTKYRTYNKTTATGQLTLSGDSLEKYRSKYRTTATGTLRLAGHSLESTSGSFIVPPTERHVASGGLNIYGASGFKTNFNDTNYGVKFYSSPILVFGLELPTADLSYTSSGELTLSGESEAKYFTKFDNYVASGELTLSGHPSASFLLYYRLYDSVITLSGDSLDNYTTNHYHVASGGLILSGDSQSKHSALYENYITSGGLILSGDSLEDYKYKFNDIASGGLILSGDSLEDYKYKFNNVASGGLILSGDSLEDYKYKFGQIASGGLILSGDSLEDYKYKFNNVASGGLILSGTSLINKINYIYSIDNANLILAGNSACRLVDGYSYFPNSGLIISGEFTNTLKLKHLITNSLLTLSGDANSRFTNSYSINSSGTLILSGTFPTKYLLFYIPTGSLVLGDSFAATCKAQYYSVSSGSLILNGTSLQEYTRKYIIAGTGNLLISGQSASNYTNNYISAMGGTLLLQNSSLYKYAIRIRYILSDYNLYLSGRAKKKKREVLTNYYYVENKVNENKVILVSTKKDDKYLNWEFKDNTVKSNFTVN
jgi:hypothetical protein